MKSWERNTDIPDLVAAEITPKALISATMLKRVQHSLKLRLAVVISTHARYTVVSPLRAIARLCRLRHMLMNILDPRQITSEA